MKALLLGSGGREYTLCHQLAKSPHKPQLFIAPGNAGTTQFGKNIEVSPTDFEGLKQAALTYEIEMVIVGPRPHLLEYNAYYQSVVGQKEMDKRHNARPGLTGLAQIRGYRGDTPNNASIHNRINSDIEYINKQSFLLDLEIITISLWMLIRAAVRRIFN